MTIFLLLLFMTFKLAFSFFNKENRQRAARNLGWFSNF